MQENGQVGNGLLTQRNYIMIDSNGVKLKIGDMIASERDKTGLRFVYLISRYDNSLLKPYIFRQVNDGDLEVVGRANTELDLTQFTKIDI